MKTTIAALVGPTGVGKTHVAIQLCQRTDAEIISMDSMQIYRGMDIGTAKPTPQEMQAVPHHLIDIADPKETFTVADYRKLAFESIDDICSRNKLPLLVGGTGLYLNAVSYEMSMGEKGANESLRAELRQIAETEEGRAYLHDRLAKVDPQSARKLHPNDTRRVIRALEIYEVSGKEKSAQDDARKEGPYRVLVYGLSLPREEMYARIDARVNEMMAAGLVHEVETPLSQGIEPRPEGGAMQAIGYKEIAGALRGEMTMSRAVDLIKQRSRRYAKRQWTWFRHDPRTQWFDWTDYDNRDALVDALTETIKRDFALITQN